MRRICNIWLVVLAVALLSGCCSCAVEEAQGVVSEADSLRAEGKMYGVDAGDSASLARAYYALTPNYAARVLPEGCVKSLSTDYAHACYHYGRLLRAKDDPVSAMEVFINGTHSRTKDYHILGRIYSNMGEIAHLAGEYALSYDMFEKSADCFQFEGDNVAYYYALNDMAVETTLQGDKDATQKLLAEIGRFKSDEYLITEMLETKAYLCERIGQYDSVVSIVDTLLSMGYNNSSVLVLKAQALWHLEEFDSALFYARKVLNLPYASEQEKYNMLYIVLNYDKSLSKDDLISLSAQRSDLETDVLTPMHNQWAVATQLLQQDLNKKPDYRWLYAILITLIIMGVGIYAYTSRKRRQHKLLSQEVDDIRQEKESLQEDTTIIQEKHSQLNESYSKNQQRIVEEIDCKCSLLRESSKIKKALAWKNYDKMCIIVDKQFYLITSKLRSKQIFSELEIRLCVLVLLNCNYDQMADLLYRSSTSIGTLKMRVAKKLGTTSKQLRAYLIENECIK